MESMAVCAHLTVVFDPEKDGLSCRDRWRCTTCGSFFDIRFAPARIRELEAMLDTLLARAEKAEAKEEEAAALLDGTCATIEGLADQQAMTDNFYQPILTAARAYCASRAEGHLRSRPAEGAPCEEKEASDGD